jgi:hypothetical protein
MFSGNASTENVNAGDTYRACHVTFPKMEYADGCTSEKAMVSVFASQFITSGNLPL